MENATIDNRRRELFRLSKSDLADILISGVRTPAGSWRRTLSPKRELMKWQKSEILGDILDAEFGR